MMAETQKVRVLVVMRDCETVARVHIDKHICHANEIAVARAAVAELIEANQRRINLIEAAGLDNLSHGVQLGQISWYVKASDALAWNKQVLANVGGAE